MVGRLRPPPHAPLLVQAEIAIVAGYGSTKDVSVYSSLGLAPAHIYIVGRAVKKFHNQCQVGPRLGLLEGRRCPHWGLTLPLRLTVPV